MVALDFDHHVIHDLVRADRALPRGLGLVIDRLLLLYTHRLEMLG